MYTGVGFHRELGMAGARGEEGSEVAYYCFLYRAETSEERGAAAVLTSVSGRKYLAVHSIILWSLLHLQFHPSTHIHYYHRVDVHVRYSQK